jgi:glycosyltransferase involved in cell wall biosynthesis
MSIKVCVIEQRGSGGMIHYAYQMCSAMTKQGADVTLVTTQDYELGNFPHNFAVNRLMQLWPQTDPLLSRFAHNRLEAILGKLFWTVRRGFRGLRLIVEWVRLTNYLLRVRPDIVQFGAMEFPFEALFLHFMVRKGLILSEICHEYEKRDYDHGVLTNLNNRLFQAVFQAFPIIFIHGESNRKRFLSIFKIPASRVYVIPHGNENIFMDSSKQMISIEHVRHRYGLKPNDRVILFFGILSPSKGISDLITAFAQVHKADNKTKLVIAGMPSKRMDMNSLFQLSTGLQISDAVVFDCRYLSFEEVGMLMRLATVVVFPYLNSTQSGAIQVAYSFGRPIVATNVGGFAEEVEDGRSGLLVPPGSPKKLAEAILELTKNPRTAQQMGEYARHLSETRFAWEPIARQILNVYETFLKGSRLGFPSTT